MSVQIALAWSPECEAELIARGFKKETVYTKYWADDVNEVPVTEDLLKQVHAKYHGTITGAQIERGDRAFFHMRHIPFMFVTTSWVGAGPD
jgi:hypothetical protein